MPRCLRPFRAEGGSFFDNDFFVGMLKQQMNGAGGHSFHLWTVMNAVLWHESWIAGNTDCF